MTTKEAFLKFVDQEWDGFMTKEGLTDVQNGQKPYADTGSTSTPVIHQVAEPGMEESIEKETSHLRVVRTKLTGDKVYLLNEESKTKVWMRNPEMLQESGFTLAEVQQIEDQELALYKLSI